MDKKRNTFQKQAVLESVRELNIHATAEQVFAHVIKRYPAVSKATVYRNLALMAETGELLNIGRFYGSAHYDHNTRGHYHFICERCKRVFDANEYFSGIEKKLSGLDGFEVKNHSLTFGGVCRDCKAEEKG